jgi:flavin-dependent dehydrogenase
MKETDTLIVGASIAGLASASLQKGLEYIIIEKEAAVGAFLA